MNAGARRHIRRCAWQRLDRVILPWRACKHQTFTLDAEQATAAEQLLAALQPQLNCIRTPACVRQSGHLNLSSSHGAAAASLDGDATRSANGIGCIF